MHASVTNKPGLSVFLPAYNDSGTIASLVITSLKTAARLTPDFEVIIVNDSADATAEIADELARTIRRCGWCTTRRTGATAARSARDSPRRPGT